MRIHIKTTVKSPWRDVVSGFNEKLFLRLNPPFPPVKLLRFDGCQKDNWVGLELNFLVFKQRWVSEIVESQEDPNGFYFVDVGRKLPFFLSEWRHRHSIREKAGDTEITDHIEFHTGTWLSDCLFYPLLWLQFLYRKPIYRKVFAGL
jgi:ligand-binding SRPBCC domain-containing protein